MSSIKKQLHILCLASVEARVQVANQAIRFAQESANDETKSTAGDKYETGRAMAQLEIEKINAQLNEAKKLKQQLVQLESAVPSEKVQAGSLVITNQGRFYISVAAGQFTIDNEIYFAVSPASPLAQELLCQAMGDRFTFNQKEFVILQVL